MALGTLGVWAQAPGFMQEDIIKVAGVKTDADLTALPRSSKITTRTYLDGWGRPIQTVGVQASPLQKDAVQSVAYNTLGQQTTNYMPYVATTTDGSYHTNAIATEQPAFYSNGTADKVADDTKPWSQQVFENSPLQRLLQAGGTGEGFQPVSGGHYKQVSYRYNTTDDQVVIWSPEGTSSGSYYAANVLSVTDGKDEQGVETLTYTDPMGQTVLKRQVKGSSYLDTYYIYNQAGAISYVVPPKAVTNMKAGSWSLSQTNVKNLIFKYVYDERGRVVEKTIPGAGPVYVVYDPLNRPVLLQDANLRAGNGWNYIKYDTKGRPISQGIYTDATRIARADMQTYVSGLDYSTTYAESRNTAATSGYYSNAVFPTTSIEPLAYSYFEDYDLDGNGTADYSYQAQSLTGEATPTSYIRGMLTMVRRRTVGAGLSNSWLTSVMFYDDRSRLIQTLSSSQLNINVTDSKTTVPDFTGKPALSRVVKVAGSVTTTVQTAYSYDHMDRLLALDQTYNNAPALRVAAYEYNELGQLVKKKLHGNNGGAAVPATATLDGSTTFPGNKLNVVAGAVTVNPTFATPTGATVSITAATTAYLQSVDYRYNIRGQLLSINNSKLTNDNGVTNSDDNDLFGLELLYDQQDSNIGNTAYSNGMISAVKWMSRDASGNKGNERSYKYTYDELMRLTAGNYAERTAAGTGAFNLKTGGFDEAIAYEENGNITSLQRNAVQTNGSVVQADNLSYNYDGSNANRLTTVTDGTGSAYTGFGFRNLTGTTTGSYSYDENGNLKADPYKGLAFDYNVLNRAEKITVTTSTSRYITYTYDAGGSLLRKQQYDGGNLQKTTDYVEGFVYENSTLAYFGMPEGRVRSVSGTLKAEYIITDQQGNARVSFEESSGKASLRQENSYYAFGMTLPNGSVATPTQANKELYNGGAEWQNDYGDLPDLQQTFYRNYDAALGRWTGVDPMADATESMSVYQYANDNPILFNDPLGDLSSNGQTRVTRQDYANGIGGSASGYGYSADEYEAAYGGVNFAWDYSSQWNPFLNYLTSAKDARGTYSFENGKFGMDYIAGLGFFRPDHMGINDENGHYMGNAYYIWGFKLLPANINQDSYSQQAIYARDPLFHLNAAIGFIGAGVSYLSNAHVVNDIYHIQKNGITRSIFSAVKNNIFVAKSWNNALGEVAVFQKYTNGLALASAAITVYGIAHNRAVKPSDLVNLAMAGISVSGFGGLIAGGYFLLDIGFKVTTGKGIGDRIDESLNTPNHAFYSW